MLGISPQRHQFCRFIGFRETRGSEYSVHCLFVYHTPCATDVDNAALYQNTEANKDGDMTLREIWISSRYNPLNRCNHERDLS